MSRENKNIQYTARDIEQYLAGKLSPLQRHALEKAALDDALLAEAIEGYESMQDTEWNNELVALRNQIAAKGTGAKIIPLHKTKNNWWKAAAAILILGGAAAITFVLSKNNTADKPGPQIAQTVIPYTDSIQTATTASPAPVTVSLNPTASASKEEIKATATQVVTQSLRTKQTDNRYITDPGAPQLKPAAANNAAGNIENTNTAAAPAINNAAAENNITIQTDEAVAKSNDAAKEYKEAESMMREKRQAAAPLKKEAAYNNFFTAQVVDAANTPLPFTNISIKKDNFGTYADAKGMVRLVSTDSILNIEVKSVGYLPKTYALRTNQAQTKIVLEEAEMPLKDKKVIGNADISGKKRTRRATLVSDAAVNAEPADGWDNYNTYVTNNLDIPDDMLKNGSPAEVELSFDVKSNGTISNIRINKSPGAQYDEAARRLIKDGPQWKVKKGNKTSAKIKLQF